MSFEIISPLVLALFCLILIFLVLWNSYRNTANRIFCLFLLSMALWGFGTYGMRSSPSLALALPWEKFMLVMISLTSLFFYYFVLLYTGTKFKKSIIVFPSLYIILVISLTPTDLILAGMQIDAYVNNAPVWGPLFLMWIVPVYLLVSLACIRLYQFYKVSESYEVRNRSVYIMIGASFCLIGGILDVLPILGLEIPPGSIIANLLFCTLTTVAILKYHLLDIHIMVRKGMAFFMISALVAIPYVSIIMIVSRSLETQLPLWVYVLTLIVLAFALQPLWKWAQDRADRFFYRGRYEYIKTLEEVSQRATQLTDIKQLASPWLLSLALAMQADKACLLYRSPQNGDFFPICTTPFTDTLTGDNIDKESLFVQLMIHHSGPIQRSDFNLIPQLQALTPKEKEFFLEVIQGALFFSLKVKGELIGILILGSKSSHQPYNEDEKQLILSALPQITVAIDNARLYDAERKRSEEFALLADLSKTITSKLNINEVFESFIEKIRNVIDIDHAIVELIEAASNRISLIYTSNKVDPRWKVGDSILLDGTATAWVATHNNLHYIPDTEKSQEFWPDKDFFEKGIRSIIHVPLYSREGIIGSFHVDSTEPNAYDTNKFRFLQQIADHIALAIENSRLYSQEKLHRINMEKQNKERIEFIEALVHEIKTPITAILASTELITLKLPDESSPINDLAENVYSSARNLNQRMTDLLAFGKMQGTQLVLDIRSIDVNDVVKQVFTQISTLLQSKNQNLSYEMNFSLPYIKADSERVVQILLNLLTNASKFSPDDANLSLRIYPTDAFLNFELLDAAPPIKPAEAKLIFTPYYRGKQTKRTHGLGLGLSICKGLVEFQGGTIWMYRREGGNIFGFSLPLAARQKPRVKPLLTSEVRNENSAD